MVFGSNSNFCPFCGGKLVYYDTVKRKLYGKGGSRSVVYIQRRRCKSCRKVHRVLSDNVLPYFRYEADIVLGVAAGYISSATIGFEDYPCDRTMLRWRSQDRQSLLWKYYS